MLKLFYFSFLIALMVNDGKCGDVHDAIEGTEQEELEPTIFGSNRSNDAELSKLIDDTEGWNYNRQLEERQKPENPGSETNMGTSTQMRASDNNTTHLVTASETAEVTREADTTTNDPHTLSASTTAEDADYYDDYDYYYDFSSTTYPSTSLSTSGYSATAVTSDTEMTGETDEAQLTTTGSYGTITSSDKSNQDEDGHHYKAGYRCYGHYEAKVFNFLPELPKKCLQACKDDKKCYHYTMLHGDNSCKLLREDGSTLIQKEFLYYDTLESDCQQACDEKETCAKIEVKHGYRTCYLFTKYAQCDHTYNVWRSGDVNEDRTDTCEITKVKFHEAIEIEKSQRSPILLGMSKVGSCTEGYHQLQLSLESAKVTDSLEIVQEKSKEEPFSEHVDVENLLFQHYNLQFGGNKTETTPFSLAKLTTTEEKFGGFSLEVEKFLPGFHGLKIPVTTPGAAILYGYANKYEFKDIPLPVTYTVECVGTKGYKRDVKIFLSGHIYQQDPHFLFRKADISKNGLDVCVQRAECVRSIESDGDTQPSNILKKFKNCSGLGLVY